MSAPLHKSFRAIAAKAAGDGSATDEQLVLINGYALAELTVEQVYVRTMSLAHNAIDRDKDVFHPSLLNDFARTLPGKGLFIKHPNSWDGDSGPGEGRFFEATTVKMSFDEARALLKEPDLQWPADETEAVILECSFYLIRVEGDMEGKRLLAKIDAGIIGDVSIGFSATRGSDISDNDGHHIASLLTTPGEALEGSLVWLGAQPGARITKSFNHEEDTAVTPEEKAALEASHKAAIKALQDQIDALKPKATNFDSIVKSVGEELADDAPGLKLLVDAGTGYRKSLVDSLIACKRTLGLMGDAPEEKASVEEFYKTAPLTILVSEEKGLREKAPKGGSLAGGEPNGSEADDENSKGLRDDSVTQKALGTQESK